MSSAQVASMPSYAFLAHPPQQKQPEHPLPALPPPSLRQSSRGRSASSIASWARDIQPGTPGTPASASPYRRPSITESSPRNVSRRRPSVNRGTPSSKSFLNLIDVETPSSSSPTFEVDLTKYGYNTVFVNMPTPATRSPVFAKAQADEMVVDGPKSPVLPNGKLRGLRKLRSFANMKLRIGAKAPAGPSSPKKIKSTSERKHVDKPMPPPLQNELLLMQFVGGGSVDTYAQRVMESQAKQAANYGSTTKPSVGDVYRDETGKIWWDKEEQEEYAKLLGGEGSPTMDWVSFAGSSPSHTHMTRKNSISTVDTDFGAPVIRNAETNLVLNVAVPLRSYYTRHHVDLAAFGSVTPDRTAIMAKSHGDHARERRRAKVAAAAAASTTQKTRSRPAPLNLAKPPSLAKPINTGLTTADLGRQSFLDSSFNPIAA